eukprot:maker-scaffold_1-snap-gene-20.62-mRNA-1 protein AED:0.00 eAED:0.00 QI:105/1/1/1/1/1/5/244/333
MNAQEATRYSEHNLTAVAITSYQVFECFIIRDTKQQLIEQRILSIECFEHWLATRQRKVKFPRESFQRTVTAHIRSADGRQPFEPDVEEALLKRIRELREQRINPFSICFRGEFGTTYKSRKLKSSFAKLYGYHEKRKHANLKKLLGSKTKQEVTGPNSIKKQLASYMGMTLEDFQLKEEVANKYCKMVSLDALYYLLLSENVKLMECCSESYILGVTKRDFESIKGLSMQQLVNMETLEVCFKGPKYIENFGDVNHLVEATHSAVYNASLLRAFYPQYLKGKEVTFRKICRVDTGLAEVIVHIEPLDHNLARFQYKIAKVFSPKEAPALPLF